MSGAVKQRDTRTHPSTRAKRERQRAGQPGGSNACQVCGAGPVSLTAPGIRRFWRETKQGRIRVCADCAGWDQ